MAHIYASNYGTTPVHAWGDLGYPPPHGRRQTGRIARGAQELAAYHRALAEVTRKGRDLDKDPVDVTDAVMAREMTEIYRRAMGWSRFDNNEDGFEPDPPADSGGGVTGDELLSGG